VGSEEYIALNMSNSTPQTIHKVESIEPTAEVDHLIDVVLESNIDPKFVRELILLLRNVGGSVRQSRLLNHILGCVIEELTGVSHVTISQETMNSYTSKIQKGGQFPIMEYSEGDNGATVNIKWVDKALVESAAAVESVKAADERTHTQRDKRVDTPA
jgi:hypothetical protein